jgi:hypothetical protein
MLPNFLKRASFAALLIAVFASSSLKFGFALSLVTCIGACIACGEALRAKEYVWAGLFLLVAAILNPVFPLPLPESYALVVNFLCLGLFASSIVHSRKLLLLPVAPKKHTKGTVNDVREI